MNMMNEDRIKTESIVNVGRSTCISVFQILVSVFWDSSSF